MTDRAFDPPVDNPFEQLSPDKVGTMPMPVDKAANDNPYTKFNPFPEEDPRPVAPKTSTGAAFGHGLERGILPAIGSLPAMGAGAEIGATIGALGGPFAWATVPAGTVIGAVAGGFLGATAVSAAQDWGLSKLPDSFRESIGQDERTQRLEESQHPTASFLGGLAPYAITMRPAGLTSAASSLPENATALQKIMAHPVTARVFGGALMGGMELGQEAVHGEAPDWSKVAISTGFGLVFNHPTRLGQSLTEIGARPTRAALGSAEGAAAPVAPNAEAMAPTEAGVPPTAASIPTSGVSFTTAKGSTYQVHADGTTTRDKAYRPEHGAAEQGLMPRSEATFYVDTNQANALGLIQTEGGAGDMILAPLGDGRWGVKYTSGKDVGKFEQRTVVTPQNAPVVGLLPVEVWKSGKNVHFGNEITEVRSSEAVAPTPAAEPPPGVTERDWNETILGQKPPTVAQAGDLRVMGPGVTESVFQGTQQQDPAAAMTVQDTARTERSVLGEPPPAPDIHGIARRMDPETMERYDDLVARRDTLKAWVDESGPDAAPVALEHLEATEQELHDLAPQIAAAYRRAADATGAPTVEPEVSREAGAAPVQPPALPTGRAPVDAVLSNPTIAQAIEHPKINRDNDVPYMAAASNGADMTTHIDRRIPHEAVLKSGTFDPAIPVNIHEQVEKYVMEKLIARYREEHGGEPTGAAMDRIYEIAHHEYAEPAEDAWYRAHGIDLDEVNAWWKKQDQITEQEAHPTNLAPNMYRKPYPHGEVKGSPHEDTGTWAEWPTQPRLAEAVEPQAPTAPATSPIAAQKTVIANDVRSQLIRAGRPPEEAEAAAQLIAARYEARAAWFKGALGTAEDMYNREGAEILRQGERGARLSPRATPAGPAARPRATWSLLEELAARGGLKDSAELRTILGGKNKFVPGFGQLIRPDGMPLDRAVEAAKESGHMFDPSDVSGAESKVGHNDLLELIDEEARGHRQYRLGREPERAIDRDEEARHIENRREIEARIDTALTEVEVDPKLIPASMRARIVEIMEREHVNDPVEAFEKAWTEEVQNAADKGEIERADHIPGWDLPAETGTGETAGRHVEGVQETAPEKVGQDRGLVGASDREAAEALTAALNPEAVWDNFVANRASRREKSSVVTGFNDDRTRSGLAPLRGKSIQDWFPGNVVDVGFVKNLLVTKIDEHGIATLVAKPDAEGQSKWYSMRPHEGLSRENGTVYFLREAQSAGLIPGVPELEYFQRKRAELPGQTELPGTETITDAELAQRRADEALKPKAEQKPADFGLFGDTSLQRELFQSARGKIRIREGDPRPTITLMKDANASTFIHETGHDFLEQLVRDSQHPAAPAQLRDDATTVIDWLGVHSAEDIKTRQHEKFARGFEQYLREGVAPSPGLAGVFAKFRGWLLNIYQTLKGLGQPISDDIRKVFDRMLATEPNRTVIAPERQPGTTLADLHAADAAETQPHEAGARADLVAAETERYIQEPPPGVRDEIATALAAVEQARAATATEPGGEAGRGAEQRGEVVPGGGQPGPVPDGGGVGAQRGEVVPVGGRPEGEGANRAGSESTGSRAGENPGGQPLAPSPATLFGARESPFLDRAGNIRVENLTTREDVAQAIRDAANENDNFIGDRRGVVTDGQVMELAEALGMDHGYLSARKIGQAFNAEQVMAARQLLARSATEVSAAMKKAATGTDQDVMAYAMAKDRHQMIQAQVSGITAEAGRALRAFRSIAGQEEAQGVDQFIRNATGKTLYQLRMEAKLGAQLDTPAKVSKFLRDAQKRSFGGMVLEYWINGLISGVSTHTTYMMGNLVSAVQKAGPETALAAVIGAARKAAGREGETVRLGEVVAAVSGAWKGLPGAAEAAMEALHSGQTTLLPGEAARPLIPFSGDTSITTAKSATDAQVQWRDVASQAFSITRGLRDAFVSGAALLRAGGVEGAPLLGASYSPLGQIPDIAVRGVTVLPLGTALRLPGRGVATIHSFFRSLNYSIDKSQQAWRMASTEGLTGNAFAARVGEIWQSPPEAVMEASRHAATELTLMGQGSEFVKRLSAWVNTPATLPFIGEIRPLKFIDPFVHIGANIIKQAIVERSPLGVLSAEIRADLMGRNGTVAQDMAQARMLAGTALGLTFAGLAMEGYVTGSGPKDPREAAMWRLAGNQAHSVRIGDTWYDVHRLGPMGMLLGVAADMHEVAHQAGEGELEEATFHLIHALAQNILDESFMRGPAELIRAIEHPEQYGGRYVSDFLSSFVPFSVEMGQLTRSIDPYSRQARTVMDAIKNKIPGLSETLLPRRDIWGEPIMNKEALGAKGLTAIYETRMSTDPVNQAMLALGINPGQVPRKIRNVDLEDQQFDDFARIAGRMTKMRLDAIVRAPDYQTWPPHTKRIVIEEVIKQSREAARGMMMMKYPQIVKDATEARMERYKDD